MTQLLPQIYLSRNRNTITRLISFLIIASLFTLSFSSVWAAPLADYAPPVQTGPADGAVFTATGENSTTPAPPVAIPAFSWNQVDGATAYRIQLSQDQSFSTKIEFTTKLTRFTPTSVLQFNDGIWYWRVKVDFPSPGSAYSITHSFTRQWASDNNKPGLVSPSDGATIEFLDATTFRWTSVLGAAKYRFQVSSSSNFTTLVYNQVVLATIHQPVTKFAEGIYYWRVIPLDPASREGTPSLIQQFTQRYDQIPALLEPANGSFPTFTPTFHWAAVQGAQTYRLQYSTDPTFVAGINAISTKNTQYTPKTTLPNDVNYYWRVQTLSGASQSGWSEVGASKNAGICSRLC